MSETKRVWTHEFRPNTGRGIFEGDRWVASTNSGVGCQVFDHDARLIAAAPELLAALEALLSNDYIDLGDLIYAVREKKGEGWDGPSVIQWSEAVIAAKAAIKKAKGETG